MRWVVTVASLIWAVCLMSCGGGAVSQDNASLAQGPFDANGNYVEAWADKRPRSADRQKKAALARAKAKKAKEQKAKQRIVSKPKEEKKKVDRRLVSNSVPKPKPMLERRVAKRTVVADRVVSKPRPKPRVSQKPKPVVKSKPRPKPKAKPKPKPKAKPKPLKLHAVKRGDTLYSISRKYGVSVSSVRKANGLRGNTIVTGKSLKIPAK